MTSRIIGITGGIAMGKTTVSNRLETYYGLTILDADSYARDAVAIDFVIKLRTIVVSINLLYLDR